MRTVEILGILTAIEIIFTKNNYDGNIIWLWLVYGAYKFFTHEFEEMS